MKRLIAVVIGLSLLINHLEAKEVSIEQAFRIAQNYFKYATNRNSTNLKLEFTKSMSNGKPSLYVFDNKSDLGFIIIAGDDIVEPVLAYSDETNFDLNTKNKAVLSWLEFYTNEIEYYSNKNVKQSQEIKNLWNQYAENQFPIKNRGGVLPLCKAKYDQAPGENGLCPQDNESTNDNKRCVTGCPATAMAIIMKYHQHPSQGVGNRSYNHTKYGTLSVNFANETYDFANMPDKVTTMNAEVSKLHYHAGVAVEMQYEANSSGSWVLEATSGKPTVSCEYAFKTYFGYDANTVKGFEKKNFTDAAWIAMMKKELDESRPMQYAGFGGGGHTWVCDGYDDNNKFHMNWGWGGANDGFFALNALAPGAGGIGSGEGTYNNGQEALMGIKPAPRLLSSAPKFGLVQKSNINISPANIESNKPFSVTVDLNYTGSTTLDADLTADVFTEDGEFVDHIEVIESQSFVNNTTKTYTFSTQGIDLVQGKYTIGIYSAGLKDRSWTLIKHSGFTNPIPFKVEGIPSLLSLESAVQLPTTSVIENKSFVVSAVVKNNGTSNFDGFVSADIFDKDGDYLQTMGVPEAISLSAGQTKTLTFTNNSSNLKQGTYLIGIFESKDSTEFNILSDDKFDNPVDLVVLATPLLADIYESNNTAATAYQLSANFVNNQATIQTTGSNIHITNDYDYYSLNLPSGYDYVINGRVNDEVNTVDGKKYTTDVLLSYIINNVNSNLFQNQIDQPIHLDNGGEITFKIAPTFIGLTGTYLLDLNITRTPTTATNELFDQSNISIYPSPTNDFLTLDRTKTEKNITELVILNSIGQIIKNIQLDDTKGLLKINVSNIPNGLYFINLFDNQHNSCSAQFIKQD